MTGGENTPGTPPNYNFLSGFAGDLGLLAATAAFVFHGFVSYRHKQCEVRRCPRVVRHTTAAGHRVCRKHHPAGAPTHAEVIAAHKAAAVPKGESDAGI
jgi:hypothetical protein